MAFENRDGVYQSRSAKKVGTINSSSITAVLIAFYCSSRFLCGSGEVSAAAIDS